MGTKTSKVRNSNGIVGTMNGMKLANRLVRRNKILPLNEQFNTPVQQSSGSIFPTLPYQAEPTLFSQNIFPILEQRQQPFLPQQQVVFNSAPVDFFSNNQSPIFYSNQLSQPIYPAAKQQFSSVLSQPLQSQHNQNSFLNLNSSTMSNVPPINYNQYSPSSMPQSNLNYYSQPSMVLPSNQYEPQGVISASTYIHPNQEFISITKNYAKVPTPPPSPPSYFLHQPKQQSQYQGQLIAHTQPKISAIHVFNKIPTTAPRLSKPLTQTISTYKSATQNFTQPQSILREKYQPPQQHHQQQQEQSQRPSQVNNFNPKSILSRNQAQYDSFTSLSEFSDDYSRNDYC
jgi:hypothetical protein